MKLQIERKYVEAMVDEFPGLAALKDQLRFGNKAEVPFNLKTAVEHIPANKNQHKLDKEN